MLATTAPRKSLLVTADDADYDEARRAWNLAVDQRPAAVAVPETVEEVIAVVNYAVENELRVAAQGTGHNAAPLGNLSRTVLVKTHKMRKVAVDPATQVARVEAGAVWADLVGPAAEHGLAALAGSAHDVGIVGYCLGGGLSWLARRYGLACNRVLAIEIVTAEGEFIRADRRNRPELFWALRGGGGNFGVVTAIELELIAVGPMHVGALFFPLDRAREVWHAWREWTVDLPESVTSCVRILRVPPFPEIPEPLRGNSFALVEAVILEDEATASRILEPLRKLGAAMDTFQAGGPEAVLQLHMDPPGPVPGAGDSRMLQQLPVEAIDAIVDIAADERGNALLSFEVRHLGGAAGRALGGNGALDRIAAPYITFGVGIAATPEMKQAVLAAVDAVHEQLAPYTSDREYLNFAERKTDSSRFFGESTWMLLREVKGAVDPDDVFQANHPIPPAI